MTRIFAILLICILALSMASVYAAEKGEFWSKGKHFQLDGSVVDIADDGIHDPANESAVVGLQRPQEAMKDFPRDSAGLIDWVQTMRLGHIAPRSDLNGEGEPLQPVDLDIIFTDTGAMPHVRFPHRQHTEWLTCKNCHPAIFKQKKGANNIQMNDIFTGKFCGVCHGKVSFAPTKNCMRCHSVDPKKKK